MGYGFTNRASSGRLLGHIFFTAIILVWSATGTPLMPLLMAQCHAAMQKPACHDMQNSPENDHACCHGKKEISGPTSPSPAEMPGCPMHEGLPPTSCMGPMFACCAVAERDAVTRRTAKPEKKSTGEHPAAQVVVAESSNSLSPPPGPVHIAHSGLRYEKPVLELKTDLRI